MHPIDWLYNDTLNLPKTWGGGDFPKYIQSVFGAFKADAAKLTATDYISSAVRACVPMMGQLCGLIEQALSEFYRGTPHQAFATIEKCFLTIGQNHLTALCSPLDLSQSLDFLYRVRNDKPEKMAKGQLFHIPFELRQKTRQQRYSVPGFPSLYLGGSVYVCWEELRCPDVNTLHMSRFAAVPGSNLRVLDFGYRPALMAAMTQHYQREGSLGGESPLSRFIVAYCLCWPLLAACSVRVRNREESFKPEYVVPNLVLQWVTNTQRFDGIRYFSMNVDVNYNDPMACADFVFPAQTPAATGYCSRLSAAFHLSQPVPWRLATGLQEAANAPPHCNWKIELTRGVLADYIRTEFGVMQGKIAQLPTGPV